MPCVNTTYYNSKIRNILAHAHIHAQGKARGNDSAVAILACLGMKGCLLEQIKQCCIYYSHDECIEFSGNPKSSTTLSSHNLVLGGENKEKLIKFFVQRES